MITLSTSRLILRPFNQSDLQNLIDLDRDPEVMKYFPGLTPMEEIEATIPRLLERQAKPEWKNYGTWMADLKETKENIGWFTLKPVPRLNNEFEVGFRLKTKFWNKGYSTEAGKFLIQYAFKDLNLNTVIALANPENKASIHVQEKCGLIRQPNIPNFWDASGQSELALTRIHKT